MLDNWTVDEFFNAVLHQPNGFEEFAQDHGRIAITDSEYIEKTYDTYVRARTELFYLLNLHTGGL